MSRFRPTSFRVAFGNSATEVEKTELPPATVAAPVEPARPELIPPEPHKKVMFEQIVIQERKCNQCDCYHCRHRQRLQDMKINAVILILIVMVLLLFVHITKSS
jgi:hypothetical protein